jgi:hypothetical protein
LQNSGGLRRRVVIQVTKGPSGQISLMYTANEYIIVSSDTKGFLLLRKGVFYYQSVRTIE